MKKIALRSRMGTWIYYTTTLTFEEVSTYIHHAHELHDSVALSDLIQRELTNNATDIADYLLNQKERLFNCLMIAVYDGSPSWTPINLHEEKEFESYKVGVLDFSGNEKFFAIDGQHRVEGIKLALKKNSELKNDEVPIMLIGYENTKSGQKKARRLFSTINRRAKRVNNKYIIALDEDDITAIVTRNFFDYDQSSLVNKNTISVSESRAMSAKDFKNFTNIMILNDIHDNLLKIYLSRKNKRKVKNTDLKIYKKYRPDDLEIKEFNQYCIEFWNAIEKKFSFFSEYIINANLFKQTKGVYNLLFRSLGLIGLSKALLEIYTDANEFELEIECYISKLSSRNMDMREFPWANYLFNTDESSNKRMLKTSSSEPFTKLYLKYIMLDGRISEKDMNKMLELYSQANLLSELSKEEMIEAFISSIQL